MVRFRFFTFALLIVFPLPWTFLAAQKISEATFTYEQNNLFTSGAKEIVSTTYGQVKGQWIGNVRAWQGIPFAQPPTGKLRWKDPKPPESWSGIKETIQPMYACMQPFLDETYMSEDCLYLNVFAPAEDPSPSGYFYPVHVFIHGGGLLSGASSSYDGGKDVYPPAGIIYVTISYRLNAFGFFKPANAKNGHYGFRDQQLALKWVKANIKNFGGDPNRVTISGQSAGAHSVHLHTISPGSVGLFAQVILMSTPMKDNWVSSSTAAVLANALAKDVGCASADDLECMQAVPAAGILSAALTYNEARQDYLDMNYLWYGVVPNTEDFPFATDLSKDAKLLSKVPAIYGTTWNEALSLFMDKVDPAYGKVGYESTVQYLASGKIPPQPNYVLSQHAKDILAVYPFSFNSKGFKNMYPKGYDGLNKTLVNSNYLLAWMYHDVSYFCPMRRFIQDKRLGKSDPPVYVYIFKYVTTCDCMAGYHSLCLYTTHGDDLRYTFQANPADCASADDVKVATYMQNGFINFIHRGNPNIGPKGGAVGTYTWPKYDAKNEAIVAIDTTTDVMRKLKSEQCLYWDKAGYYGSGFSIGDSFY